MSAQRFTPEFKEEAVKQVAEKGPSVAEVEVYLRASTHYLHKWVKAVSLVRSEQQSQELYVQKVTALAPAQTPGSAPSGRNPRALLVTKRTAPRLNVQAQV